MDEYIVTVIMDNKQDELKTYASSTMQVLDSMVSFEDVQAIKSIYRVKDKKTWQHVDADLPKLRALRNKISDEGLIQQELRTH